MLQIIPDSLAPCEVYCEACPSILAFTFSLAILRPLPFLGPDIGIYEFLHESHLLHFSKKSGEKTLKQLKKPINSN